MRLGLEEKHERFRDEVRAFLSEHLTETLAEAGRRVTSVFVEPEYSLKWQRILLSKGWVAPHWPAEVHLCQRVCGGRCSVPRPDGPQDGRAMHHGLRDG